MAKKVSKKKPTVGIEDILFMTDRLQTTLGTGVDVFSRTIYLTGEITDELAQQFIQKLTILDTLPGVITIRVNSVGGEMSSGMAMYDTMRMTKNEIIVDVVGAAFSAAVMILQAGDLRRMSNKASLMLHEGQLFLSETSTFHKVDLTQQAESLHEQNELYVEIVAERSKLTQEQVREICKKDTYFNAKQAIKAGLVDEVLDYRT